MTLRDYIYEASPTWLKNYYGERLMYSAGIQIDAMQESLRQGVLARFPGYGSNEALPYIGRDRGIQRGPNEPLSRYVIRLQAAFDTWKVAGNAATLLRMLSVVASPTNQPTTIRTVSQEKNTGQSVWHKTTDGVNVTKYVTTPGWDWDGDTDRWARLWVIIDAASAGITQWHWGDPGVAWGDGHTWGSSLTVSEAQTIRTVANTSPARAAHTLIPNIIIDFSAGFSESNPGANPTGDWDNPVNRNPGAIYLDGNQ